MSSWFDDSDVPKDAKNLRQESMKLMNYFESGHRRSHVISVRCLYNFGRALDHDGYRGLCVHVKSSYELTPEDKIWLHPDHFKSLTIAKCNVSKETMGAQIEAVRDKIFEQSMVGDHDYGVYLERTAEEYSSEMNHAYYATFMSSIRSPELSGDIGNWVTKARAARVTITAHEDAMTTICDTFPSAECIFRKTTNVFMRDNATWRFLNCAWNIQPDERDVYIRIHPSIGYARLSHFESDQSTVVPIDMGFGTSVTAYEVISSGRQRHIKETHCWDCDQPVHLRVQHDSREWKREAPLRRMGLYDPKVLATIAIKMGYPQKPLSPSVGRTLTSQRVLYDFDSVYPLLTRNALKMIQSRYVNGESFALTDDDLTAYTAS